MTASTNIPESNRFLALTGIRFIAAAMVFVYHNRKYWPQLPASWLNYFTELHNGVSLFFVLSGFLIAWTYGSAPLQTPGSYGRYLAQRAARILPLYWLVLTCYYADASLCKNESRWLTYSLGHAFSNTHNLDAISQSWSLNVEMVFYMFAPLLYFLYKQRPVKAWLFLLGLLGVITAVGYGWHYWFGNRQEFFYPFSFILQGTFFGRCTEFMAGLMLASYLKHQSQPHRIPARYKTWAGALALAACLWWLSMLQPAPGKHGFEHWSGRLVQMFVFPAAAVCLLWGLIQEQTWLSRVLSSRIVVLLGNASFAFYLIHISYVNQKLKAAVLLPDRNFVLLWLLAIFLYLCVEKPVYNFFRQWLKKKT